MASMFKPYIVRYVDAEGRQVKKGSPGAVQKKERAKKWYAQIWISGKRKRVPLCTDKSAARKMLSDLEVKVSRGQAGLLDPFEEHLSAPISDHLEPYFTYLDGREVTPEYRADVRRKFDTLLKAGPIDTLSDFTAEKVIAFLDTLAAKKTGPVTRTRYLSIYRAFTRWCVRRGRIAADPLASLERVTGPPRRPRRSLTPDELTRLLKAARERPLAEVIRIKHGKRKGELSANIRPDLKARWEQSGLEHSLVYKTLVYTGLRRGELEVLEVRHLKLDGPRPHLALPSSATKNDVIADIPLRADLVTDLKAWIARTHKRPTDRVFSVGEAFILILRKDLKWAGIDYRDAQGRYVDVHSLRHTTATFLALAKVAPAAAQRFMRHADIKLTLQTYADSEKLDEREALDAFPALPLENPEYLRPGTDKTDKTPSKPPEEVEIPTLGD